MSRLLSELQRRSVIQVAAVYAAVAFIALQVADLTFPALSLSEGAYRVLVWLVLAGFPAALLLAWFFDIRVTAPDPAPAEASAPPPRRPRYQVLSIAVILVLASCAGGVTAVRARMLRPHAADGRIAIAVFPFRATGIEGAEWSEGAADLLSTALEGTEGVRVVDPWALWQPLRGQHDGAASSPDPLRAAALGREVGARRVVLGSTVANGDRIDLTVRIYDPRVVRPLHTIARSGSRDDLAALVQRLSIAVITRVWDGDALPGMTQLEPNVTQSPDALKAYLAAKIAMRRGWADSAATAIERAIALDSTFALALIDAVTILSWHQVSTGRPYAGFPQLLLRAQAHADSLAPRHRLRLDAVAASVDTRGADAAAALRAVTDADSMDIAAWSLLSYVHTVYGWQYGATARDALHAARRVVRLDPRYVPGLVAHAWQELALDSLDIARHITSLAGTDTTIMLARSTLLALRALAMDDARFAAAARALAESPLTDWLAVLRFLRVTRPDRSLALLDALRGRADPQIATVVESNHARQLVAQGRTAAVDSAVRAGAYAQAHVLPFVQLLVVGSHLAGVGDAGAAAVAADALARYVPADSVAAYFYTRPAWWVAWSTGAYHAAYGDTAYARRVQRGLLSLPAGGSPATYREALVADIDARLAARAGDAPAAVTHARRALELWSIHTENQPESMPEPAMRFHLALLLRETGAAGEAQRLLESLVPPAGWFGFLTARAHFELGELALVRDDADGARRHYNACVSYWTGGGVEVEAWLQQARERLARLRRPT